DGRWTVGTYDEGHSTDSMLLDEHPPYDGFGSVQDAVDWLNEHIGWIGDFRLQKVGAEKASSFGYDIDGRELRIGDAVYNIKMDMWFRIDDVLHHPPSDGRLRILPRYQHRQRHRKPNGIPPYYSFPVQQ
ncbi:MAG: hypothetical protein IJJ24_10480, partial [Solobacterium sp.]|nr:hypothetical protein [Solobacterium sp.]